MAVRRRTLVRRREASTHATPFDRRRARASPTAWSSFSTSNTWTASRSACVTTTAPGPRRSSPTAGTVLVSMLTRRTPARFTTTSATFTIKRAAKTSRPSGSRARADSPRIASRPTSATPSRPCGRECWTSYERTTGFGSRSTSPSPRSPRRVLRSVGWSLGARSLARALSERFRARRDQSPGSGIGVGTGARLNRANNHSRHSSKIS